MTAHGEGARCHSCDRPIGFSRPGESLAEAMRRDQDTCFDKWSCGPVIDWRQRALDAESALAKADALAAALEKRTGYSSLNDKRCGFAGAEGTGYLVYRDWRCCGEQLAHKELNGRITKEQVHECDATRALADYRAARKP